MKDSVLKTFRCSLSVTTVLVAFFSGVGFNPVLAEETKISLKDLPDPYREKYNVEP